MSANIFRDPETGDWYEGPAADNFRDEEELRAQGIVLDPVSGDYYQVPESSIPHWRKPEPLMAPQAPDEPTIEDGVGLADYARSVMAGGAQIGQAAGWLMKQAGVEQLGSAIEELGRNAVDYWNEGLSPAAKDALAREFVRKNEAGEYEWGDANLHTVGLFGAQSLLGSAAGAGAGAGITKVLQAFANPVGRSALMQAAKAGSDQALKKLALVDKVIGAAGFATGEGIVGGASAGVNVYDRVMQMSPEEITKNDRYRQVFESTDEALPLLERHQYAAETVAREASSLAGLQSGLTTALLGAPMGAFFGSMFGKSSIGKLVQGKAARAGTGAAGEAAQEFAQGAAEQRISNEALQGAGVEVDDWEGVLNSALGGALAGAPLGAALGLAEQPEIQTPPKIPTLDEMAKAVPPPEERLALPAPRGEADFTVGPDGEAIPRGETRPERLALPPPGGNADFTVTAEGETIPRGEQRTTQPDPMRQWARDARATNAEIRAAQAERAQQEGTAMGTAPTKVPGTNAKQWNQQTLQRLKAAATEAKDAGVEREAIVDLMKRTASGEVTPLAARRELLQMQERATAERKSKALPAPRPAAAFEAAPTGEVRQLTEAEARQADEARQAAAQERVELGTAPTVVPGTGQKKWTAASKQRVKAAMEQAVNAGVPREVAQGVVTRMNKGEISPLVASKSLKQLQSAKVQTTTAAPTQEAGTTPEAPEVPRGEPAPTDQGKPVTPQSDKTYATADQVMSDGAVQKKPLLSRGAAKDKQRIGLLPRDMREELFGVHATFTNPDATQADFNLKVVPKRKLRVDNIEGLMDIPAEQLERYKDPRKLPPVVIADGRLVDGQHRIARAKQQGITELDAIDMTGLVNTEESGYITELPTGSNAPAERSEYAGAANEAKQATSPTPSAGAAPAAAPGDRFARIRQALRSHRERNGTKSRSYSRRGGEDGGGVRVLGVQSVASFAPDSIRSTLSEIGAAAPTLHELGPEGAQVFADSLAASKQGNKFGAAVYVYPVEEYRQMRLFLAEDGKAGFALKGDDIVSVFALAPHKGAAAGMLELAVQEGGRRLDAFDTVLPDIYAASGFRTVARIGWNDDYAPEGWDKGTFGAFNGGQPDVVFMVYDPANANPPTNEDGQRVEDYDAAVALQKEAVGGGRQTDTAAFKRWFGDSKVVDGKGQPLRVYHGTASDFDTFDPSMLRAENAFFFVAQPYQASEYASAAKGRTGGRAPNVMPVYLSIQNPLKVTGADLKNALSYDRILAKARRDGHDGLIVTDIKDTPYPDPLAPDVDVYVAFKPEQIKSATGNTGDFDPSNPSILRRQGAPSTQARTAGAVQEELKDFIAAVSPLINVRVWESVQEFQVGTGAVLSGDLATVKGAWFDGHEVHLVAENLTPGEALEVAVHEVFGHLAIERLPGGEEAIQAVRRQIESGAAWVQPYVDKITPLYGNLTSDEMAREVIAHMAEEGADNRIMARLLRAFREFLRKFGWKGEESEVRDLIVRSARALRQDIAKARQKLRTLTPAATDQQILDAIDEEIPPGVVEIDAYLALRAARDQAAGDTADIDAELARLEGKSPPGDSTLRLKKPLQSRGQDQIDTPAFRKWFGDSKVVDANGRPLRAYHGTPHDFEEFDTRPRRKPENKSRTWMGDLGSWFTAPSKNGYSYDEGNAEFMASEFSGATEYDKNPKSGGKVIPAYLSVKNPAEYESWEHLHETMQEAGGSSKLRASLEAAGHDGIVIRDSNTDGNVFRDDWIVFEPTQIKSATGNRGTFDPSSRNILFKRAATADPAVQAILDRVMVKPPEAMTMRDRARELWHKITDTSSLQLKQGFIDSFASIEALERDANNGALKDAAESAYKAALATKNLSSVMAGVMLKGVPSFKGGTYVPEPGRRSIIDIFDPLTRHKDGNLLSQWEGYAAARRASRLIKETNVDGSSRENLFTQAEIDTLLTLGKKYPEFAKVFDEWQTFNKQVLDLAQEAGVIDPETRVLWERNDYVPFYRAAEELGGKTGPSNKGGLANQSSGIRQLKGGEAMLGNVFENMMMNTAHLIDASFKNRAMQRIVELGTGTAMEKVDMSWEAVKFNDAQLAGALRKAGIEVDSMDKAQREHWSTLFRRIAPRGPNIVSVMKDGKPEYYEVTDPLVLQSIAGLGYDNFADVFGLFRGSKKLLTNAITADPAFMLANFVRDTLSNWVISDAGTKPMIDAVKALKATLADDPDLVQLMMAGAGGGGFYDSAPEDIRKLIADRVPANQQRAFLDSVVGPKNVWRLWRKVGAAAENANRIATFRAVIAAGGTVAEAAYQARDVLNFSMAGNFGAMRWLTQSVPFLNARVQGLYRLYRGARDNKRAFFMKGLMLSAATMALALANADDDEYEELPEWDKDTYWHLFVGGEHFRIPKPFEVGALFSTIPERLFRTATGRDSAGLLADRIYQMAADTFAFNPVPQLVKPIIEQYANRSMFTGSPIVGMAELNLQPEAQFTPWTSETMRELAKLMPDFAPEWLRSPRRLEAALRAYTGAIGMYILGAADAGVRTAMGYAPEPSKKIYDLPVVTRFWEDPNPRHTKYADQLYEMMDEANAIASTVNRFTRERRFEEAAEMRAENKDKLAVRVRLNRIGTQVRNVNNRIRLIQLDETMPPDMKRQRIDELVDRKNRITREVARYADVF